ncbi:MAG: hypothetical protein HY664_03695 [Chloroflexi bacterium]|nr:hypothetical protein [Chloroflexota bacterium]
MADEPRPPGGCLELLAITRAVFGILLPIIGALILLAILFYAIVFLLHLI